MVTMEYIAGILDGEGSFGCQLKFSESPPRLRQITPRVMVGFKQSEKEVALIDLIQRTFGVGKTYVVNDGKENGLIRWQTSTTDSTLSVCKKVLPYLQLKDEQCKKIITIAELILSKKGLRYFKGPRTERKDVYTKEELKGIAVMATTMNSGRQVTKYRDSIGRNTEHYLNLIDRMYEIA